MVSCSVKEDRAGCPCYLIFPGSVFSLNGFEGDIALAIRNNTLNLDENPGTFASSVLTDPSTDIPAKRGNLDISGVGGLKDMTATTETVTIPKGKDCDSLYAFSTKGLEARTDVVPVPGDVYKQYASVLIQMKKATDEPYPFHLRVRSNVCGMDRFSLAPIEGEFEHEPKSLADGVFTFCLPRQKDSSLEMDILDTAGNLKDTLPIGEYIINDLKYDWNAISLADIEMVLDYAHGTLTITVSDWELVEILEVEI